MGGENFLDGLRARVQQAVAHNAVAQAAHGLTSGPATAPEKQWWNVPAKYEISNDLATELKHLHLGRNNHDDALRHAEWSQGMTEKVGPIWSAGAGAAHELFGLFGGYPLSESVMDMRNNAEGIQAALHGRPVNTANLQDKPMSLSAAYAGANQGYEDATPDKVSYPTRPGQGTAGEAYKDAPRYAPEQRYPPYR